ncbi:MAG: hypothetical protein ACYTAS_22255 [Planctomycetota bacterium]|jgi:hypothetical protein
MSQLPNVIDDLSEIASWGSRPAEIKPRDSRTVVRRTLRAVLPSAALVLSMSMLTAIILILIVTAVAQALPPSQSNARQSTAWSRWNASPDISIGVQETLYADFAPFDAMAPRRDHSGTMSVALQMPRQPSP